MYGFQTLLYGCEAQLKGTDLHFKSIDYGFKLKSTLPLRWALWPVWTKVLFVLGSLSAGGALGVALGFC